MGQLPGVADLLCDQFRLALFGAALIVGNAKGRISQPFTFWRGGYYPLDGFGITVAFEVLAVCILRPLGQPDVAALSHPVRDFS